MDGKAAVTRAPLQRAAGRTARPRHAACAGTHGTCLSPLYRARGRRLGAARSREAVACGGWRSERGLLSRAVALAAGVRGAWAQAWIVSGGRAGRRRSAFAAALPGAK